MQNSSRSGDRRVRSGVRVRVEKKAPMFFRVSMKSLERLGLLIGCLGPLLDVLLKFKQLLTP